MDGIGDIIKTGQEEGAFIEDDSVELATSHLSLAHVLLLWNAQTQNPVELTTDKV